VHDILLVTSFGEKCTSKLMPRELSLTFISTRKVTYLEFWIFV